MLLFLSEAQQDQIESFLREGLITDGNHHKQWYLAQITKILAPQLHIEDEGIPP